ncbi:HD domain-containing protein [Sinosporangium album]|nr:HD domain-containing protein [Sinosporangium album]
MGDIAWARDLARKLLERPLPRRFDHSRGVAGRAETLSPLLGADAVLLTAAAWLHDIGYAPELVDTGAHQLDGARYLRDVCGADERLCSLVAHHSCAVFEADQRGLLDVLHAEFPQDTPRMVRAMTYCDMTTSPVGEPVDVDGRLAEIYARYGADHVVSRSIREATGCITSAVRSIERELSEVRPASG